MEQTRRTIISRLREGIKEVSADSNYTNRYLWHVFSTASHKLFKEDADKGKIYAQSNPWESICVEMEPVSSLFCDCIYLPYNCEVFRSKFKLPKIIESSTGFIYRMIASPDLSQQFTLVSPYLYSVKSKIKYNKEKYAFFYDDYLYTPNHRFPSLVVAGLFQGDTSKFNCKQDCEPDSGVCGSALNVSVTLNDYLIDACIKIALTEILPVLQKQQDNLANNNETQKEVTP